MKISLLPVCCLPVALVRVQSAADVAFVPFSFGFSVFSVAVGVVGTASSVTGIAGPASGAGRVAQGTASVVTAVLDPSGEGTFYSGQIVLDYPSNLVAISGIGWFGYFSADPSL